MSAVGATVSKWTTFEGLEPSSRRWQGDKADIADQR